METQTLNILQDEATTHSLQIVAGRECTLSRDEEVEPLSDLWDSMPRVGSRNSSLVPRAKRLMRQGRITKALQVLEQGRCEDAESLNLKGILYELLGRHGEARVWYGRALAAEQSFWAARMNLQRNYELRTFGSSDIALLV